MKILKYVLLLLLALSLWFAFVIYGSLEGLWKRPIAQQHTEDAFIEEVKEEINKEFVGNMALALIEDGVISKEFFHTVGEPVDRHTMFQIASVSKWVTSWGVFALIEGGSLDLDAPVATYLTRWSLPDSEHNHEQVTIRRLLSHTAGLTDGLGYAGFRSIAVTQSLEQSLTRAADAMVSDGVVRVGTEPGSQYQYSGGGYTILQLIIEEVSGLSFNDYMKERVFAPLHMNQSTYIWSDTLGLELATFYNTDGAESPHYRYSALAAASLYTCLADLELFILAHFTDNNVLSAETIELMSQPIGYMYYQEAHGLGPMIYGDSDDGSYFIGHEGNNRPAINTSARLNPTTKDGIIILETGNVGLATFLTSEWAHWKTGVVDLMLVYSNRYSIIKLICGGWMIIGVLIFIIYRIKNRV